MISDNRRPFFYDVTLRDGNQALKKPWNTREKEIVFGKLVELGVQGVEAGFSGASEMDFEACNRLAAIAPDHVVISGLARAVERDIRKVAEALRPAKKPRIHTFIALSPFNMENVLRKEPAEVARIAVDAVGLAASLMPPTGDVQFSAEHFGDCEDNIDFVIETFLRCVAAGARVINLPNTVERNRPGRFLALVEKVVRALPSDVTVAVHCHNDLGMATATTVESFFTGATQLEVCLNGLGERAGNTNIYEVAVALHNCGVSVPLDLGRIYETALVVEEMSKIPIPVKSPLIGPDALAHRSGIHQDGTAKTKGMEKGAYRPIHPSLIGRDDETLGFTSQSGKTAVYEILTRAGWPIVMEEAVYLQPILKTISEKKGQLEVSEIVEVYLQEIFSVAGPYRLESFREIGKTVDVERYEMTYTFSGERTTVVGEGDGPIDACLDALTRSGRRLRLVHYEQAAISAESRGAAAQAMTVIRLEDAGRGKTVVCRGKSADTRHANLAAIFNGLNLFEK